MDNPAFDLEDNLPPPPPPTPPPLPPTKPPGLSDDQKTRQGALQALNDKSPGALVVVEEEPPVLEVEQVPTQIDTHRNVIHVPGKGEVPGGGEVSLIQVPVSEKKVTKKVPEPVVVGHLLKHDAQSGFEEVPIDDLVKKEKNIEDSTKQQTEEKLISRTSTEVSSVISSDQEETLCGFGTWRPGWLQKFATPWGFMAVFSMAILLQGIYFTYFIAVLTTVEKRFQIKSKTTGLVLAGNDISEIMFAVLLTYFGGKGHRPKWISWGIWGIGISCFIMASPNFLLGSGDIQKPFDLVNNGTTRGNQKLTKLCELDKKDSDIPCKDTDGEDAFEGLALIFLAFFVCGFGVSVVQPLGLSYYDDNLKATQAPLYHGALAACRVLGPFCGYGLGSLCLRLYVNPGNPPPGVTLEDPRWIGAWWLGYVILGCLMMVVGVFVHLFPRRLPPRPSKKSQSPEAPKPEANGTVPELSLDSKEKEAGLPDDPLFPETFDAATRELPALKEIPAALKRLLTNQVYVFHMLAVSFHLLANIGFFSFSPKYLESQFRKSAATSSLSVGFAGVLVMAVGMVVSGYVIKRYKPSARVVTAYHAVVTLFNIIGLLIAATIGCSSLSLFSTTDNTTGLMQLNAPCNAACNCSTAEYNVICMEPTNVHFYNPCFGGCTGQKIYKKIDKYGNFVNQTVYTGCTCGEETRNFTGATTPASITTDLSAAVQGYCSGAACSNFIGYLTVIGITKIVASTSRVGGMMITIRSVEKQDKSLAVGLSLVIIAVLAFIPTPILYGAIVDSTCLIWRETKCRAKGNCSFYDASKFRMALHITPAILLVVALVLEFFVWKKSKRLELYGSPQENKPKPTEKSPPAAVMAAENPAYNPDAI